MLKGLKGILEKGLQIAAPFIGVAFGGPIGSALGTGLASLLTGNKPKDALMAAGTGYLGGKMGFFGDKGDNPLANLFKKQFTPSQRQPQLFESAKDVITSGGKDKKSNIFQSIMESFQPRTDKQGEVTGPGMGMQALAALGPGVLSYMAAKQDAAKAPPQDPSKYMSSVDTMYGGQFARPPEERRIRNMNVQVDPTTGKAVYAAGGGIMDVAAMEEVSYPVTGLAGGGFPRKTGSINGPGTKTSDSIRAMLSDGEFVQKTDAVNGAGILMGANNAKEARDKGADFMYALQDKLARVGKNVA